MKYWNLSTVKIEVVCDIGSVFSPALAEDAE